MSCNKVCNHMSTRISALRQAEQQLRNELREASKKIADMRRYVKHEKNCDYQITCERKDCTCGLVTLLEEK